MQSLGLGGTIPKKDHMWSSAILPGSVELVHVDRKFTEALVGATKTGIDQLTTDVLKMHN
ncbi:hypothetical protein PENSPDRAFT_738385, partial [Peniophora sp. CONT]